MKFLNGYYLEKKPHTPFVVVDKLINFAVHSLFFFSFLIWKQILVIGVITDNTSYFAWFYLKNRLHSFFSFGRFAWPLSLSSFLAISS
jgi:hypothetical protein